MIRHEVPSLDRFDEPLERPAPPPSLPPEKTYRLGQFVVQPLKLI
jgi:hypothetical protein